MLQPKKIKLKKLKKNYLLNSFETKTYFLTNGFIGLKALESRRITARQIESARQAINRELGRRGKVWIKIFPNISVTQKPTETRMGKGKGSISYWCAPVKIGTIFFEVAGVSLSKAKQALLKGLTKLPIKTKIITN